MSNEEEVPPIGGVKVKIKDGNGDYVTSTLTLGSTGHKFWKTVNSRNDKVRLQESQTSSDYLASASHNGAATWSRHVDTPEWTLVPSNGKYKLYIHDNTREYLAVDNSALVIREAGSEFEFVEVEES